MAEGLIKQRLEALPSARPLAHELCSAGTAAVIGYPAEKHACQVVAEYGIDISSHRAQQVDERLLRWAELVLTMERHHNRTLYRLFPACRGKVFLLGHWPGVEIPDPVGQGMHAFQQAFERIVTGTQEWIARLDRL